jgi:hypothetical protein
MGMRKIVWRLGLRGDSVDNVKARELFLDAAS